MTRAAAETALQRYAAAAREHGQATEDADYRRANRAYRRLEKALREIVAVDPNKRLELAGLLLDEDPSVRCWAATHLLPIDPETAVNALRELSEVRGFIGLGAQTVLSEFAKGTLRVP